MLLRKMVEIMELADNEPQRVIEKQLNDRSYGNKTDDSGLVTSNSESAVSSSDSSVITSSGYESSNGSRSLIPSLKWENIEGEVVSWGTFSLIMQSSNLVKPENHARVCDISSIEHTGLTPILRKGNIY